jgi:hypothetical protein
MAEWMRNQVPGAGPDGIGATHKGWLTSRMFTHPDEYPRNAVARFMQIYETTFRLGTARAEKLEFAIAKTPSDDVKRRGNGEYLRIMKSRLLAAIRNQFSERFMAERFGAWEDRSRGEGSVRRFGLRLLPGEIEIREG